MQTRVRTVAPVVNRHGQSSSFVVPGVRVSNDIDMPAAPDPVFASTDLPSVGGVADPVRAQVEALRAELAEARQKIANLEIALESSREIGAAIGILMNQRQITVDEAFQLLRTKSQRTHRKLRDVASEVLYTGSLTTE